jgi:hypothetical protein
MNKKYLRFFFKHVECVNVSKLETMVKEEKYLLITVIPKDEF